MKICVGYLNISGKPKVFKWIFGIRQQNFTLKFVDSELNISSTRFCDLLFYTHRNRAVLADTYLILNIFLSSFVRILQCFCRKIFDCFAA